MSCVLATIRRSVTLVWNPAANEAELAMTPTSKAVLLLLGAVGFGMGMVTLETLVDPEPVGAAEFVLDSIEKSLVFIGAGGVLWLLVRLGAEQREKQSLVRELERARDEGAHWRAQVHVHVSGLSEHIARQLDAWGLTQAEAEVALAVLKGLSHKEIAVLRGTSEATVRQQARSIYQKSNISGKAAFSAYFLEDLLAPASERATAPGQLQATARSQDSPGPSSRPRPDIDTP